MADPLPIYEIEQELVATLRDKRRLIVCAPTGSGKSTQVPQMLLSHGLLGDGQVVILQPRRLAARLLARRVAEEMGVPMGREVGYTIRFENVSSSGTRIRFVTEGVLLRQMLDDPQLNGVSALIFDEFHERHLYGDITLARALDLQEQSRPDLRLLVMSATLDLELLRGYLGVGGPGSPCGVLASEGRMFPVDIEYMAEPSYLDKRPVWEQAADAFAENVRAGRAGDVLVFMPGSFEISQTINAIRQRPESRGFILLPLHGELPPADQDAAVARHGQPKVVVATNVAETSLTIDGIRLVIDSGLARIPRYDPCRGINTLLIERISRASAEQRAGRAGRTAPGRCVRLWSAGEHADRPERELPEIKRLDLAEVVLTLKAAGVEDLRKFRWLEPPDERALARAEELLVDLGALRAEVAGGQSGRAASLTSLSDGARSTGVEQDNQRRARPPETAVGVTEDGTRGDVVNLRHADTEASAGGAVGSSVCPVRRITALGRKMLAFPVHPRYARMLLAAQDNGCVYQACLVAALTQGRDLLLRNVDKVAGDRRDELFGDRATSDFWVLMRAWNYARQHDYRPEACRRLGIHALAARQVAPLFEQFLRIAGREGLDVRPGRLNEAGLQKCILAGFPDHLARRVDAGTLRCELIHGRRGVLARESVVQQARLFVAAEVREVEGRDKTVNTLLSLATEVEAEWLREMFPEDLSRLRRVYFDAVARRVYAEEQVRFRDLTLETRPVEPPPADEAGRLLAEEVLAGRLKLRDWDQGVEQWILRLNFLARWCPELGLPAFTDEARRHVVEQVCHGAFSYKEIKEREVRPLVRAWLSESQQALLDKHAPERLELGNGRRPRVIYSTDAPPHVAVRIQELYGVSRTPHIAMGRVPVVVHIMSPGMKPVQVTRDLAGFWREHYPRIKQELQRRYPKHEWR